MYRYIVIRVTSDDLVAGPGSLVSRCHDWTGRILVLPHAVLRTGSFDAATVPRRKGLGPQCSPWQDMYTSSAALRRFTRHPTDP